MTIAAILFLLLALAGTGLTFVTAILVGRSGEPAPQPAVVPEPVTLLKPLHGAEPRLAENLATFLDQDWAAPTEMVAGVQRADDPAIAVARSLGPTVTLVVDPTPHGANAKVGNILNMMPAASHDLLVLSDSDMVAPRDYLAQVAAALAAPGVGVVSCLWRGRGDAGPWSALCAGSISYAFLPAVLFSRALGLAQPCMGSTIALRRATLARIGGFEAFADTLADDYLIGEAVRGLGLTIAIPPMILAHGFTERSFAELWRHELRWAATTRGLMPWGYAGTVTLYPLPFALLAIPFAPAAGLATLGLALAARLLLKRAIDRRCGASTLPGWMLPLRDGLSFAVFVASFFVRSVDWRGARLTMGRDRRTIRAQGVTGL
jgi:ceramide glucosyltransferase